VCGGQVTKSYRAGAKQVQMVSGRVGGQVAADESGVGVRQGGGWDMVRWRLTSQGWVSGRVPSVVRVHPGR
jgi:hypothetical protein